MSGFSLGTPDTKDMHLRLTGTHFISQTSACFVSVFNKILNKIMFKSNWVTSTQQLKVFQKLLGHFVSHKLFQHNKCLFIYFFPNNLIHFVFVFFNWLNLKPCLKPNFESTHFGSTHTNDPVGVEVGIIEEGHCDSMLACRDPVPLGGGIDLENMGTSAEDWLLPREERRMIQFSKRKHS